MLNHLATVYHKQKDTFSTADSAECRFFA